MKNSESHPLSDEDLFGYQYPTGYSGAQAAFLISGFLCSGDNIHSRLSCPMNQPLRQLTKPLAVTICVLFVSVTVLFVFRPHAHPPSNLVEPRLLSLRKPYTSVEAAYHTDGGSVSVVIIDAMGRREKFGIPHRMGRNENYQQVYVGGLHKDSPGAISVEHHAATKEELICLLAEQRSDAHAALALAILSGRLSDQARNRYNAWRGNLNNP